MTIPFTPDDNSGLPSINPLQGTVAGAALSALNFRTQTNVTESLKTQLQGDQTWDLLWEQFFGFIKAPFEWVFGVLERMFPGLDWDALESLDLGEAAEWVWDQLEEVLLFTDFQELMTLLQENPEEFFTSLGTVAVDGTKSFGDFIDELWVALTGQTLSGKKSISDVTNATALLRDQSGTAYQNAQSAETLARDVISSGSNIIKNNGFENIFFQQFGSMFSGELKRSGNFALKLTGNGATTVSYSLLSDSDLTPTSVAVTAGDIYYAEVWVRGAGSNQQTSGGTDAVRMLFQPYSETNVPLAESFIALTASTALKAGWNKLSGYVTMPPGSKWLVMKLLLRPGVSFGEHYFFDDVTVREVTLASAANASANTAQTTANTASLNAAAADANAAAADTKAVTAQTSANTANTGVQTTVDNIFRSVFGGTSTGNPLASITSSLQKGWSEFWDGLTGGSGSTTKLPGDVRVAAAGVRSTANNADTTANTATSNLSVLGNNLSTQPQNVIGSIANVVMDGVASVGSFLNNMWEGLTGGSGTGKTVANVKVAAAGVNSTANNASATASTAVTNAAAADTKASSADTKATTAQTNLGTLSTNLSSSPQTVIGSIANVVMDGVASVGSFLNNLWEGLTGQTGTGKSVANVKIAAAGVNSTANTASTTASTAVSNAAAADTKATTAKSLADKVISSGSNLATDPGFESGGVFVGTRVVRSNEMARTGSFSGKATVVSGQYCFYYPTSNDVGPLYVPASPGDVFYVEAWVYGLPSNASATQSITFQSTNLRAGLAANNSGIGANAIVGNTTHGAWRKVSGYLTMPADTYATQIYLYTANSMPAGNVYFFDDVTVREVTEGNVAKTNAAAADTKAVTAQTTANTATTNIQTVVDNIFRSVFGGTSSNNPITSVVSSLQKGWAEFWDGLTGSTGTATKLPGDVRVAAAGVRSTANNADATAGTASSNVNLLGTNLSTQPQTVIGSIANVVMDGVASVGSFLNNLWEGLTGGTGTGKTVANVKAAAASVNSTANTASTTASTAVSNAAAADAKAVTITTTVTNLTKSGTNLVVGGDFEDINVPRSRYGSGTAWGYTTDQARSGTRSWYWGTVSGGTNGVYFDVGGGTLIQPIEVGEVYTAEAWVMPKVGNSTATGSIQLTYRWGDSTGINANTFSSTTIALSTLPVGQWSKISVTAPCPAGRNRLVVFLVSTSATGAGNTFYVDDMSLREVTAAQAITDGLHQAVNGGTAVANPFTTIKSNLQTAWSNFWDGLNGTTGSTNKLPADVRVAAAGVRSTANNADTTASTASSNVNLLGTNLSTQPQTVLGSIVNVVMEGATSVGSFLSNLWEGLTGGTGTGKTVANVKAAAASVNSTANTASTTASTAVSNAAAADTKAVVAQTVALDSIKAGASVLPDGGFENTAYAPGKGQGVYETSVKLSGANSMSLTGPSKRINLTTGTTASTFDNAPACRPSSTFYVEGWVYGDPANVGGGSLLIYIDDYNAAGVLQPQQARSINATTALNGVWTKMSGTVTLSANAAKAYIFIYHSSTVPAGDKYYYDNFVAYEITESANTNKALFNQTDAGTTILAGAVPGLEGSKITSGSVAADRIANLPGEKITSGTVAEGRVQNLTTTRTTANTTSTNLGTLSSNLSTAPQNVLGSIANVIMDGVSNVSGFLTSLWRGLTGNSTGSGTVALVQTAAAGVNSTANTASTTANTAVTNAAAADTKATTAQSIINLKSQDFSNLLPGSDFESTTQLWPVTGQFSIATDQFRSGSKSLKIVGTGSQTNIIYDQATPDFEVKEGDQLYIELWVKKSSNYANTNASDPRFRLTQGTGSPNPGWTLFNLLLVPANIPTTNWTKLSGTYTIPAGHRAIQFMFLGPQAGTMTGTLWVDDIVVRRVAKPDEIAALDAAKIASGTFGSARIADGAVTTAKIPANAVTATQINAGAVTNAKVATNAIATANIQSNAVTTAKIPSNAITTALINTGAVTANELAAASVTNAKVATDAIATANIQANAVNGSKTTGLDAAKITTGAMAQAQVTNLTNDLGARVDYSAYQAFLSGGSQNICSNPGFEDTTQYLSSASWGGTYSTVEKRSGARSALLTGTAATKYIALLTNKTAEVYFNGAPSRRFYLEFYVKTDSAQTGTTAAVGIGIWSYTAANASVTSTSVTFSFNYINANKDPVTGWARCFGYILLPATATIAKLRPLMYVSSGATSGNFWFDDVLVQDVTEVANTNVALFNQTTSGTTILPGAVPGLEGSKITGGTVAADRIANLAASKITSGTFPDARIASGLNAAKLTTGTLPIARIADAAITTAKIGNNQITGPKTAGLDGSKITGGSIAENLVQNLPQARTDIQNTFNKLAGVLTSGEDNASGTVIDNVVAALLKTYNTLQDHSADLQALKSEKASAQAKGAVFNINFSDYSNGAFSTTAAPGTNTFRVIYSGVGTSTLGVQSGVAQWYATNNADRNATLIWNTPTNTDFQVIAGTMTTPPQQPASGVTAPRFHAIGRVNSTGNTYVWARAYSDGFLSFKGEIGRTVSGVETVWATNIPLTWSLDMRFVLGVGTNARQYQVYSGSTLVWTHTESGAANVNYTTKTSTSTVGSTLGASNRQWGAIAQIRGGSGGPWHSGKVGATSVSDNESPQVNGSVARMDRTSTANVSYTGGSAVTAIPNSFFNVVEYESPDVDADAATSSFTVKESKAYIITGRVMTGNVAAWGTLILQVWNGSAWVTSQYGNPIYTQDAAAALHGQWIQYLTAGQKVRLAYQRAGITTTTLTGEATGSRTYFSIAGAG